jgi:hypothetical protein
MGSSASIEGSECSNEERLCISRTASGEGNSSIDNSGLLFSRSESSASRSSATDGEVAKEAIAQQSEHFQSDHWKNTAISMNITNSNLRDIIKNSWMEVLREHSEGAGSVTKFYNELVARLHTANVNGQFDRWLHMTVPAHGVAVDANFKAVSVMMRMIRAITKVDPRKPQV